MALWDCQALSCVRTWAHMDHAVRSVSLSSDGRLLAYATEQQELEVLSTETGERLIDVRIRCGAAQCARGGRGVSSARLCDSLIPRARRGEQSSHVALAVRAVRARRTQVSDGVAWSPTHNVLAYCDEAVDTGSRDVRSFVGVIGLLAPPKA